MIILKYPYYSNQYTDLKQSLSKYPWHFSQIKTNNPKIHRTTKGPELPKSSWEKWSCGNQSPWLQIILQNYSHQDNMVLAQKQEYRPMEQDRNPRDKSTQLWALFPVVMYGCESWTIKEAEYWRTDTFELWCWGILFRVSWTARRSNQ